MSSKEHDFQQFYMAWHKDSDVLQNSSSGGVFTALAEYVFSNGGVVCGAALNPDSRKVEHVIIDNSKDLSKLRLSKYYQSECGNIYLVINEILKKGTMVLFTGTACQIAALYQICGKPENLITADVLCHGVTSKYVVDSYINSQESSFNKTIKSYYFRVKDKLIGWSSGGGTRMKLVFNDDTSYITEKGTDTFFVGFNKRITLRESCYNCKYCGLERIADFTIGDFWGVTSERATEEQKQNGISLLLVNSERGNIILDELNKYLEITSINPEEAIPFNRALEAPNVRPKKRNKFFSLLKKGKDYNSLVKRFYPKKYLEKMLKNFAKKILGTELYERIIVLIKGT